MVEYQSVAALAGLPRIRELAAEHAPENQVERFGLIGVSHEGFAQLQARFPDMEDLHPLSPMQQTLLVHNRDEPGSAHISCLTVELRGPIDAGLMARAWQHITDRHPALRSVFVITGDPLTGRQLILRDHSLRWTWEDARATAGGSHDEQLTRLRRACLASVTDPAAAPPIALALIQVADDHHHLLFAYHHVVLDDRSLSLVWSEAFATYQRLLDGDPSDEGREEAPAFRHFIGWLERTRDQEAQARARDYWRDLLAGAPEPVSLADARSATVMEHRIDPVIDPGNSPVEPLVLGRAQSDRIRDAARRHRIPLAVLMQGAWVCLIGQHSGQNDVVHGMKVAGRPAALPGATDTVGVFANLVPCRLQLEPEQELLAWLRHVQEYNRQLHRHEQYSLHRIHAWAGLSSGYADRFGTILSLEGFDVSEPFRGTDMRVCGWDLQRGAPAALSISLASIDRCLSIRLAYRTGPLCPGLGPAHPDRFLRPAGWVCRRSVLHRAGLHAAGHARLGHPVHLVAFLGERAYVSRTHC